MSRKDRILQHLQQTTQRFAESGFAAPEGFETEEIARALHLDRANVSKLLNELWNGGLAVKVQGRPTLYLSLRALEAALPGRFVPGTLASAEELLSLCADQLPASAPVPSSPRELSPSDSLLPLAQEALSVCSYPPYGLPLLLVSPSTKDVETVVNHVFARLKERRGEDARLIMIDCRGNTSDDNAMLRQLFGCSKAASPTGKTVRGCFESSGHGVICLVGVHRLNDYVLELLLTAVDRHTYCRMGETVPRPLDATLILSLPPQNSGELLTRLNKHVPCLLTIPSLDSRSTDEKLLLLLRVLEEEATSLGRTLRLDKDALAYLLASHYPAGISDMRGVVKLLCSTALRLSPSDREKFLAIQCQHLPQRVVADAEGQLDRFRRIYRLLSMIPGDYLFLSPDGMGEVLRAFHQPWLRSGLLDALPDDEVFSPDEQQLGRPEVYIQSLLDYLRHCDSARITQLHKAVPYYIHQSAARLLERSPAGVPLTGEPVLLLGLLISMHVLSLRGSHLALPEEVLPAPEPADSALTRALFALFNPPDGFSLSPEEEAFFSAYLSAARACCRKKRTSLLILCHGKSIASEYASMLETYGPPGLTVAAVDVSVGETLSEIADRACETVQILDRGGGVAIAADMPPLLSLAPAISQRTGIPCRGVCEVSLSALMDLSEQCVAGRELTEMASAPSTRQESPSLPMDQQDPFMHRYLYEVFAPNLTFLDLNKAAGTLSVALSGILGDLKLPYSREAAVKFLSHSSYMLERVIAGHTMTFPNLRRFLTEQHDMVSVVSRRMEPVGNTFGCTIPAAEIAYIAEIFLEFK